MSEKIRDTYLDETKGLAEILVVLTHVIFLGGYTLLLIHLNWFLVPYIIQLFSLLQGCYSNIRMKSIR